MSHAKRGGSAGMVRRLNAARPCLWTVSPHFSYSQPVAGSVDAKTHTGIARFALLGRAMPVRGPHREDWPALPLSRTVHTVLVFAARETGGSSMGCGNQRRGRPRQYEKSGLGLGFAA